MIDLTKLEWGLRPFREVEALAVYGARTIFRDSPLPSNTRRIPL